MKKYTSVLQGAYQDYDISITSNDMDGSGYFNLEDIKLSNINEKYVLDLSCAKEENKICQLMIDLPKGTDLNEIQKSLEKDNPDYYISKLVDQESVDSGLTRLLILRNRLAMVIGSSGLRMEE